MRVGTFWAQWLAAESFEHADWRERRRRSGVAGVQSVGPGVRHCGEVGEQFGHLDAEDGDDGECQVD
jgi:hypothetical protein